METLKRETLTAAAPRRDQSIQEGAELPPMQQLDFHVESAEAERSETLFSAAARPEFIPRKTEPKDILPLMEFISDNTSKVFASADIGMVYEKSCFSLVLVDQIEVGKLVAHASFADIPMDPIHNTDGKRWRFDHQLLGITSLNTMFMHMFVISREYTSESCLIELIANTFLACHDISNLIVECPTLDYEGPFAFTNLARSVIYSPKPKIKKKLIIYEKDVLFPHLIIREGREHDLDDLTPQLTLNSREMEDNFGKSYLSDLIALTDRNNQSIVAEFNNEAVGIAIVTTDINYKLLNHHFHLEAFHGLFKPHEEDLVHIEAQQSTLLETVNLQEGRVEDKYISTPRKHLSRVFRRERTSQEELEGVDIHDSDEIVTTVLAPINPAFAVQSTTTKGSSASGATSTIDTVSSKSVDTKELFEALKTRRKSRRSTRAAEAELRHFTKQQPKHKRSDEIEYEVKKSGSSQLRLLQRIDDIIRTLEENGMTLETAYLDETTLKLLASAEEFIQQCVNVYLHRALIDEKVLPMDDWNEPPMSRYVGLPNAIAIQVLTMDKRYHMRLDDLIHNTFLTFPNRDYVIITIPSHLPEPVWTKYFSPAMKRKDSVYPKSLYVLHRAVCTSTLRVRIPTITEYDEIRTFLSPIVGYQNILADLLFAFNGTWKSEAPGEMEDVNASASSAIPMIPFILEVIDYDENDIIVGFAMISTDVKASFYQVNYNLDSYTYANDHKDSDYAYVHHFLLSPLFQMHSKVFMKDILRKTKKHFAFHKLLPFFEIRRSSIHQSLLNNIEDWFPLAPRKRINYNYLNLRDIYDEDRQPSPEAQNYSISHGVIYFSKKFLFDQKPKVGARIVFIGASETAISAIEKLVFMSHLTFKHLTIISPNGIPGSMAADPQRNLFFVRNGSASLSMSSDDEYHHRLCLRNHINVVYGTVTKLLRNMKLVLVNGRRIVRYDLLICCAGRQFIRPDCPEPEIEDEHLAKFHQSITTQIPSDYTENRVFSAPKPLKRLRSKPLNVFLVNNDLDAAVALNYLREYIPLNHQRHIIVHGDCLDAYCCINTLLQLDIDSRRIVLVTTPDDEMDWEKYHSYTNTSKLKEVMTNTLKHLGIRVVKNYVFRKWNIEGSSNLATRIFFTSPTEEIKSMSISCLAYFPFIVRRVSDEMASVLTESFLAFSNGILIDTGFQTSDPNIWAAGPCAAYNKSLGADKFFHGFYSSNEIGKLLADLIIKKFDPTADISIVNLIKPGQSLLPPLFTAPIVKYAQLPAGWFYLHMRRPGQLEACCHGECSCPDCDCGTEIVTGSTDDKTFMSTQKYFRLWLNSFQRVEGLECISRIEFSPSNLCSLYGHHETFLNKLLDAVTQGEVHDLYAYFEQPWIAAICHDRWIEFREELQNLYAEFDIGPNLKIFNFIRDYIDNLDNPDAFKVDPNILRRVFENSNLKSEVELKFLEFLKYNRAVLPMYARPDFVEQMFEEREASPMYFPQIPNF